MKLIAHRRHEAGNALMATLLIASLIGFSLAGYLQLVSAQNRSVMRSLAWNSAISVAEAGIEEALTHIYKSSMNTLGTDSWDATTYPSLGGQTLSGTYYIKKRDMGDGYYRVAISSTSPPVIISESNVKEPINNGYIQRVIQVTTQGQSMFPKGLVAKGQIDLNGQNVISDSFDSSNPAYSTNGKYDASKARDNGDMATNSGITGIFSIGNANVYGHAGTGPGGSVTVGPNGGVGSHAWQSSNSGLQPGWVTDDMNIQFPDATLPFTGGYSTPAGNPLVISSSGNWQISGDLTKSLVVNSNVQAVLVVTGNVSLNGNSDKIEIKSGGSLKMYVQGASTKLAGQGVINGSGNATNFMYYGLPSNTSVAFSGNAAFTGTIYAPNADFTLGGGGNNTQDFSGAGVVNTVKMNGHFNFHYDEDLGRTQTLPSFVITSWNEI